MADKKIDSTKKLTPRPASKPKATKPVTFKKAAAARDGKPLNKDQVTQQKALQAKADAITEKLKPGKAAAVDRALAKRAKQPANDAPTDAVQEQVATQGSAEHVSDDAWSDPAATRVTDVSANGEPKVTPPKGEKKRSKPRHEKVGHETPVVDPSPMPPAVPHVNHTLPLDADKNGVVIRVTRLEGGGVKLRNIQPREREILGKAAEHARQAGSNAQSACKLAECTMGEGEAETLKSYAEQLIETIKRASGVELKLASGEVSAGLTGLNVYHGVVERMQKKDQLELVPDDVKPEQLKMIVRLQRALKHRDTPDAFVEDTPAETITHVSAPVAPPPAQAALPFADAEPHDIKQVVAPVVNTADDGIPDEPPADDVDDAYSDSADEHLYRDQIPYEDGSEDPVDD